MTTREVGTAVTTSERVARFGNVTISYSTERLQEP